MPRTNKTMLLKVRLSAEEHLRLAKLTHAERSLSAFVRKQVFGRESEITLYLARIHGSAQALARELTNGNDPLPVALALAHLVAIERHLQELLTHFTK